MICSSIETTWYVPEIVPLVEQSESLEIQKKCELLIKSIKSVIDFALAVVVLLYGNLMHFQKCKYHGVSVYEATGMFGDHYFSINLSN